MLKTVSHFLSYQRDKLISNRNYWKAQHKKINWHNPQTYNDHLYLAMIDPEAEKLWKYVDKLEVRKYVEKRIGPQILNKVEKVFDSTNEIDFDLLPNKFALKTNHASSWNVISDNKKEINWQEAKNKLDGWLNRNYYHLFRERPYKLVKPKIFLEKYLENKHKELPDYKFFCFHGQVKFIQVNTDRYAKNHRQTFFDLNWKKLPFYRLTPSSKKKISPPSKLADMLTIASKLSNSKDFVHVRVDLYQVDNKIYFGELTLTPGAGVYVFMPYKYEYELGKYF